MADATMHTILTRMTILERTVARYERRRRTFRRIAPLVAFILLLAFAPLTVLADFAFLDLDPNSPHNDNISAIKAAGITKGCDPPAFVNYCPTDTVTRQEMASFLARLGGRGGTPPVANAQTAQTAANAANAAALQGYAANGLVR